MRNVKAIISLSPGEVGFFDDLSRTHLTVNRPRAEVYEHTNTEGLIRAVRSRAIRLERGTLIQASKSKTVEDVKVFAETIIGKIADEVVKEIKEELSPEVLPEVTIETVVEDKAKAKTKSKKDKK